jgi:hypothetical protein
MAIRPRVRKTRTWLLDRAEVVASGDVVVVVFRVASMVLMFGLLLAVR